MVTQTFFIVGLRCAGCQKHVYAKLQLYLMYIHRQLKNIYTIQKQLTRTMSGMGEVRRKIVSTDKAPGAIGPYNQAVLVDQTLYISGQIGFEPSTMEIVGRENGVKGHVQKEANQALKNMGEILKAVGASYNNVVKTTVLLADINDFVAVNEVYKTFFTSNYPARAAYQVGALPKGALVEIEAVAVVGKIKDDV